MSSTQSQRITCIKCGQYWDIPVSQYMPKSPLCFECRFMPELERMIEWMRDNYQTEYKIDASV